MVYYIRKLNGAVEKGHKVIKTRKMKNFNEQAVLSDVAGINWEQILTETDDINVLVNHWTSTFSLVIDKHAPLCEMRVSEKYCPWIDREYYNNRISACKGNMKESWKTINELLNKMSTSCNIDSLEESGS